jgi:hypothetical protein
MLIMVNATLREVSAGLMLRSRNIGFRCDVSARRKSGMFFRNTFAAADRGHPQRTGRAFAASRHKRTL